MATNFLTLRNTQQYNTGGSTITDGSISITSTNKQWWTTTLGQTLNYSTLTGSTISAGSLTGSTINFTSNVLALGPSTTITPGANLSNGTWSTWATARSGMTNVRKVASSSTGQYRLILIGVAGTSALWLSSDSGVTWSQCTAYGLPAGSAYDYRCGSISADGAYITIGVYGDTLYTSTDSGATFNNPAPSATPYAWLRCENSTADTMGNSTVTTPGTAPTFSSTVVPYSGSAYSMRLTNTAGSTASQYVRGTWAGAANFTVSFWMNPQSFSASNNIQVFSAYTGVVSVFITQSTNLLTFYIPTGGSTGAINVGYTTALSTNTWYYVTGIFQTNGLCSFYVNNSLIGTYVNSGGFGSYSSTGSFGIGTFDTGTTQAFNGFIDDFRLYNTAITYQNVRLAPYAWLKFENSVADAMGAITPAVTGSVTYVPGVVGSSAVVLANTAGGTATSGNYIRGAWTSPSIYTVSGSFNVQSYSGSGNQYIFVTGDLTGPNTVVLYIDQATSTIRVQVPNAVVINSNVVASLNTWYSFSLIIQPSGSFCTLYLNGTSYSVTATGTATPSGNFGLGTTASSTATNTFNGYIDDLRIYNAAVLPPNASTTQLMTLNHNWSQIALSGSGQYQLAATDYGQLYKSTDYGATWAASVGATGGSSTGLIKNLTMSHSGQYMLANAQAWATPNSTSVGSPSWTVDSVFWSASASSTLAGGYSVYGPFDTVVAGTPANSWNSANTYNLSGAYTGAVSTTVLGGVGAVTGEYLQLQSTVPLVLSSYSIRAGGYWQFMKTGYLVGSTDGISWYPLQNISYAANPYTVNFATTVGTIQVNYTGTQSVTANTTVSATTTAYSTSATPYTYFRLIAQTIFSGVNSADCISINEWYPNFLAANTYTPQQTGLATSTWSVNGVTYTASASSLGYSGIYPAYYAFNNNSTNGNSFYSGANYNSAGAYTGSASTTILGGIGAQLGEWLQIQSSVPMVLQSYTIGAAGYTGCMNTFYLVGSNDGTNWYPLQYAAFTTTPFTANFQVCSNYITVNYTGTQTVIAGQTGSITTTAYSYTTQSFSYFRLVGLSLFGTGGTSGIDLGELYLNFLGGQTYSTNYGSTWSVVPTTYLAGPTAISGSGQYQIGANNTPLLARLTLDGSAVDSMGGLTAATGAGTVTYSTSIVKVGTHSAFFNNTAGGSPSVYLNYTVPTLLNTPSALTMSCWIYPTALGPSSYGVAPFMLTDTIGYTHGFFINSNGTLQYNYATTVQTSGTGYTTSVIISLNVWTHLAMTFNAGTITVYVNGVLVGSVSPGGVMCASGGGNLTNVLLGTAISGNNAYQGYVDDVRLYTSALTAAQVAALYADATSTFQSLAVTSNYLAGLTSSPSAPVSLTGATLIDTATSYTGQYMIVVTAATSGSNVYYSTNYGSSWTGVSVGLASAPLVSCAMSYDGSYATVASSTVVYTLNNNGTGFTLALGAQAGAVAQGANSIAIGNKAGIVNQAASSIVMNATGSTLTACGPGFYVAPIQAASAAATTSGAVSLLGYGDDKQVVQTGLQILPGGGGFSGQVGVGTTIPMAPFNVYGGGSPASMVVSNAVSAGTITCGLASATGHYALGAVAGDGILRNDDSTKKLHLLAGAGNAVMTVTNAAVGIGTTAPIAQLYVYGQGTSGGTSGLRSNSLRVYGYQPGLYLDGSSTGGNRGWNMWVGVNDTDGPGTTGNTGAFNLYDNGPSAGPVGGFRFTIRTNGKIFLPGYTTTGGLTIIDGATGEVSVAVSDRRLKENIVYQTNTSEALSIVQQLKPATFTFIDKTDTHLGFIAQDVEELIPLATDGKKFEYEWETDFNNRPKFDDQGQIIYRLDENGERVIRPRALHDRAIIAVQTLAIQELAAQLNRVTAWARTMGYTD